MGKCFLFTYAEKFFLSSHAHSYCIPQISDLCHREILTHLHPSLRLIACLLEHPFHLAIFSYTSESQLLSSTLPRESHGPFFWVTDVSP
jgi:hypothetical protein